MSRHDAPKLESRYIVLKLKDADRLSRRDQATLERICAKVRDIRTARGAMRDCMCLVVEKDWPEYEPTLAAILARVDRDAAGVLEDDRCPACKGAEFPGWKRGMRCSACADWRTTGVATDQPTEGKT